MNNALIAAASLGTAAPLVTVLTGWLLVVLIPASALALLTFFFLGLPRVRAERARFLSGVSPSVPVLDPLPGAAMGRLFGRDFVVHVAIAPGKLGESLVIEAGRLSGIRTRPIAVLNAEVGASG